MCACLLHQKEDQGKYEFLLVEKASAHLVVVDVVNMGIIGKHANDQSLYIMIALALYELTWNENCNSELFVFLVLMRTEM